MKSIICSVSTFHHFQASRTCDAIQLVELVQSNKVTQNLDVFVETSVGADGFHHCIIHNDEIIIREFHSNPVPNSLRGQRNKKYLSASEN